LFLGFFNFLFFFGSAASKICQQILFLPGSLSYPPVHSVRERLAETESLFLPLDPHPQRQPCPPAPLFFIVPPCIPGGAFAFRPSFSPAPSSQSSLSARLPPAKPVFFRPRSASFLYFLYIRPFPCTWSDPSLPPRDRAWCSLMFIQSPFSLMRARKLRFL